MKTLYLVRHAKSSWHHAELRDFERPLNKKGIKAANLMAQHLNSKAIIPEVIISSPAKRALTTATIFADIIDYDSKEIIQNQSVYGADVLELLTIIMSVDNSIDKVMLFGHEPTLSYFTRYLTGWEIEKFSTAGIAKISFNFHDWNLVNENSGKLEYFIYPKMFD